MMPFDILDAFTKRLCSRFQAAFDDTTNRKGATNASASRNRNRYAVLKNFDL